MKILYFGGGLGNQIFQYAFYQDLLKKNPSEKILGVYNKKKLSEHYGLEVNKWFKVNLPKETLLAKFLVVIAYLLKKIGYEKFLDRSNGVFLKKNAIVINAYREVDTYIPEGNWLPFNIPISSLSLQNKLILSEINSCNSVFIHVRRGDYLNHFYKERFEGTCPISYYNSSIADIITKINNPHFFVFSDDIDWAIKNIKAPNIKFIDWNIGENSPIDLFLMSQCKFGIIANSTFSFWAAKLGYKKEIVYYPTKWFNDRPLPKFIPNNWLTF